jgi:fatty-acyl-CoA synthase
MSQDLLYQECTFADLWLRALRRFPDRIAIVAGAERITYAELERRIGRTVAALKGLGVKRGDALAQLAANRAEVLVVSCACNLMGVRATPLHPLGSEDDHAFVLEDAEIDVLLADEAKFAARAAALRARSPRLKHLLSYGPADFAPDLATLCAAAQPVLPLVVEATPDDILSINYTGGTTGRSKGVVHRSRSFIATMLLCLTEWDWPDELRLLAATPVSHAAGAMFVPCLMKGGTYVIAAGFDAEEFLGLIERERITSAFLVPTMIYVLLDHPKLKHYDTSSLKVMIYGAAPMSPTRLREATEVFGPVFMQLYGQTEAPQVVTALRKADHDLARPERLGSCGVPAAGVQVKLLDAELREVPVGETGEICVRGPLVMEGYWKRPEETAAAFRGGWLHTGDMAKADADGFLYIVDRSKDMIISGGFNVFPREIEDVLTQHPAVSAAAVIGVPDPKWGEAVKAIVVRRPGSNAAPEVLIAWVRDKKGAVYAPKSIDFADSLPVTALGKPDKKALRAKYWTNQQRQVS